MPSSPADSGLAAAIARIQIVGLLVIGAVAKARRPAYIGPRKTSPYAEVNGIGMTRVKLDYTRTGEMTA